MVDLESSTTNKKKGLTTQQATDGRPRLSAHSAGANITFWTQRYCHHPVSPAADGRLQARQLAGGQEKDGPVFSQKAAPSS
jgi:hypothetical protein